MTFDTGFWARVEVTGFCWLWRDSLDAYGYGVVHRDGKRHRAHRHAYSLLIGPPPADRVLDHLCRVKTCVNPDHLEPVTIRENTARGQNVGAQALRTGFCINGHPRTPENLLTGKGSRGCSECRRNRRCQIVTCPACSERVVRGALVRHRRRFHDPATSARKKAGA